MDLGQRDKAKIEQAALHFGYISLSQGYGRFLCLTNQPTALDSSITKLYISITTLRFRTILKPTKETLAVHSVLSSNEASG